MKPVFVETENVKRFHAGLSALRRRGAEEACLMVLDGKPGLGKTTLMTNWIAQVQNKSVYLRAAAEWSPMWFLSDLLADMRLPADRTFQGRYRQVFEEFLARQHAAELAGDTFALVIDEADHISRRRQIMETVRDFSDGTGVPVVLVGMGRIRQNLTRYPQIASRVSQYVEFREASREDVALFIAQMCDVPVADDLVQLTHTASEGFNREIKEAIATIERFARRQRGRDFEAHPVSRADLAGQPLLNKRRDGRPVIVPETVV